MALVAKPTPLRDLSQVWRGLAQEVFRLLDASMQDVLMGGETRALLEQSGEMIGAQVCGLSQLGKAQIFHDVRLDMLQCASDLVLACRTARRRRARDDL